MENRFPIDERLADRGIPDGAYRRLIEKLQNELLQDHLAKCLCSGFSRELSPPAQACVQEKERLRARLQELYQQMSEWKPPHDDAFQEVVNEFAMSFTDLRHLSKRCTRLEDLALFAPASIPPEFRLEYAKCQWEELADVNEVAAALGRVLKRSTSGIGCIAGDDIQRACMAAVARFDALRRCVPTVWVDAALQCAKMMVADLLSKCVERRVWFHAYVVPDSGWRAPGPYGTFVTRDGVEFAIVNAHSDLDYEDSAIDAIEREQAILVAPLNASMHGGEQYEVATYAVRCLASEVRAKAIVDELREVFEDLALMFGSKLQSIASATSGAVTVLHRGPTGMWTKALGLLYANERRKAGDFDAQFAGALRSLREADRSTNPREMVLRAVTGVEQLLVRKSDDKVKATSERSAVLLASGRHEREAWINGLRKLYEARSRLIHGDQEHVDLEAGRLAVEWLAEGLRSIVHRLDCEERFDPDKSNALSKDTFLARLDSDLRKGQDPLYEFSASRALRRFVGLPEVAGKL